MKRPSAGRGEYEIAERLEPYGPTDLVDREFILDLGPFGQKPTGVTVKAQGGKLRLRRLSGVTGQIQLPRQVEAAAMLPKSIRDETQLPAGQPVIMANRYLMRRMHLSSVQLNQNGSALLKFGELELANQSHQAEPLNLPERLASVRQLHSRAGEFPPEIRSALQDHAAALAGAGPITAEMEAILDRLMNAVEQAAPDFEYEYVAGTDVLLSLEQMLPSSMETRAEPPPPTQIDDFGEHEIAVRRREAKMFQVWAARRGYPSVLFRKDVRTAYDSRCVVCGMRFPPSEKCPVSGVDAAHILPWAIYDLDHVTNGLCLCKLHHWAFDAYLITIVPSDLEGYEVKLTRTAQDAFETEPLLLGALRQIAGPIPPGRLPADKARWPNPNWLLKRVESLGIEPID